MTTMQQPFAQHGERVVFISPEPVEHVVGEIPAADLTAITEEFFRRIHRNPAITPQQYAIVADYLMSECHEDCRTDPLYNEPTTLPSLSHDQCDYFMGVATVLARDIKSKDFADQVESYLFPPSSDSAREVMWAVLHG